MDQDFIADDDENTQETGDISGLTLTGEEESQSQSMDAHPRGSPPPSKDDLPMLPPPQWFLDGMNEISGGESDDEDVFGYLADRSRNNQAGAETNDDGKNPEVSCDLLSGLLRNLIHTLECR
jgi:hypothetical protein